MASRLLPLAFFLSTPASAATLRGSWLEISVGSSTFSVKDFGAKGDGKSDDTQAVQDALDAAAKAGGGTVEFPPGNYLTAAFHFSGPHTTIHLPIASQVIFDSNRSKYDGSHNLIEANYLHNIGIVGGGTFNGQGSKWWGTEGYRPRMVHFKDTDHVLIMDCLFRDSPKMFLALVSNYAEIKGVKALAPPSSGNTDGVDVHGSPFYIHDCHFDTGDDDVSVSASDLLVENCYFGHGHGASIGSVGNNQALRNITFRNIVFNETDHGARIKTDTGARNTTVRDILWENITLYNVHQSIVFDMFYGGSRKNETTDVNITNVTIRNLTAYGTTNWQHKDVSPGNFHCQESSPCRDIHLSNIRHVDSKKAFDCYNAFGTWHNVSPKPCISDAPAPTCDVDGCFSHCVAKYGGTIESDSYTCCKGCAGMSGKTVVDKDKFCSWAVDERAARCMSHCDKISSSDDKAKMCKYGCSFWSMLDRESDAVI